MRRAQDTHRSRARLPCEAPIADSADCAVRISGRIERPSSNDVHVSSIHDVLEQYRSVAFDEYGKGAHFERLMQAFLRTEPQHEALYDEVWRWSE